MTVWQKKFYHGWTCVILGFVIFFEKGNYCPVTTIN